MVAVLLVACVMAGFAVAKRHSAISPAAVRPLRPGETLLLQYGQRAYQAGNYELARRLYVRAVRRDPTDREAQEDLGCALLKLGVADSAQVHFQQAHREAHAACNKSGD